MLIVLIRTKGTLSEKVVFCLQMRTLEVAYPNKSLIYEETGPFLLLPYPLILHG